MIFTPFIFINFPEHWVDGFIQKELKAGAPQQSTLKLIIRSRGILSTHVLTDLREFFALRGRRYFWLFSYAIWFFLFLRHLVLLGSDPGNCEHQKSGNTGEYDKGDLIALGEVIEEANSRCGQRGQ